MTRKAVIEITTAEQYIDDVLSGRVVVCRWVRLAVERHVRDLAEGPARGLQFNRAKALRAIEFFKFLKHSKGEWAGKSFTLSPWQCFIVWCVFGWQIKDEKGRWVRRFKKVHQEVARKNGKSTMLAGIGLYLLVADGEDGAEVYSAATKKDQAKITHDEAIKMVKASPDLAGIVRAFRDSLAYDGTGSVFKPLASEEDSLDGLNVSGAIIDELHAHRTRKVYDVLDTATGARAQPLVWAITTAGAKGEGLYNDEHLYAQKVLNGEVLDDSYFAIIFCIDEGDDWADESVWVKANPNLGVSVSVSDLRRKAARAKEMATVQNDFIRLHMNRQTQQVVRWLDLDKWDACGEPFDPSVLEGRPCFGGLDLSTKLDLTAWVMVFPPVEDDPFWYVLVRCFVPADNAVARERKDRVPYSAWEREGHITMTEGNVVDYDFVRSQVEADCSTYQVVAVAYDAWNATQIANQLQQDGVNMVQFGQGFRSMSEPSKEMERLVVQGMIRHGGHPIAKWCAGNVAVETDPAGNIKPSKKKSTERIDVIVALVMALGLAITQGDGAASVYETGEGLAL